MKTLYLFTLLIMFSLCTFAQVHDGKHKRLDSLSGKVISYLKNKMPDSVYALCGKTFKEKITAENFNSITTTQIFPINNFEKVTFINNMQGINKYKVEGNPDMQLLIGLDTTDKIETLLVQPYVEK